MYLYVSFYAYAATVWLTEAKLLQKRNCFSYKKSWKLLNTLIAITKLIICITPKNKLPTLSNRILDWVISYNSSLCMSRPLQLQDSIFQKIMIQCFNDLALTVHIIMQLLYVCIHDFIVMFILYVLRIALKSLS